MISSLQQLSFQFTKLEFAWVAAKNEGDVGNKSLDVHKKNVVMNEDVGEKNRSSSNSNDNLKWTDIKST